MKRWIVNKAKNVLFYATGKLRIRRITISGVLLAITIWTLVVGDYELTGFVLAGTVIVPLIIRRSKNNRTVRIAKMARVAELNPNLRSGIGPYLLHGERVDYEDRQHPVAILRWWLLLFGGPLIGIVAGAFAHSWIVFGIFVLGSILGSAVPIMRWRMCWRIITDKRLIIKYGVLVHKTPAIPLTRILMITPADPVYLNRFLQFFGIPGERSYNVDTASEEDQIFHTIGHVPQPESSDPRLTVQALLQRQIASVDSGPPESLIESESDSE